MSTGFVYIMSNASRSTLYIGVTSDLKRRVAQHKAVNGSVFTSDYKCYYLVYYEQHPTIKEAIIRETQMKRWYRSWKDDLIKEFNPTLKDLWEEI